MAKLMEPDGRTYATHEELCGLRKEILTISQVATALDTQRMLIAKQHDDIAFLINRRRETRHAVISVDEYHFFLQNGPQDFLLHTTSFQTRIQIVGEATEFPHPTSNFDVEEDVLPIQLHVVCRDRTLCIPAHTSFDGHSSFNLVKITLITSIGIPDDSRMDHLEYSMQM